MSRLHFGVRSGSSRFSLRRKLRALVCEALEDRSLLSLTFSSGSSISGPGLSPFQVADDAQGNSVVVGSYSGTTNFDPNPADPARNLTTTASSTSGFVAKYSPAGALLWVDGFEAGTGDYAAAQAVVVAADGSIFVAGQFTGQVNFDPNASNFTYSTGSLANTEAFVLKLSPSGTFSPTLFHAFSTTGNSAEFSSLAVDPADQSLLIGGDFLGTGTLTGATSSITGSGSGNDSLVLKVDSNLTFIWGEAAGIPKSFTPSVRSDAAGDVFLAGKSLVGSNTQAFIQKYSGSGALQITDQFGFAAYAGLSGLAVDPAGDVYVVGSFYGVLAINFGKSVSLVNNGGSNPLTSNADIYLAKFNSSLTLVWANELGSTDSDFANTIALDFANNLYLGGVLNGSANYGPGPGSGVVLVSAEPLGSAVAFLLKVDPGGNYLDSAASANATSNVAVDAIAVSRYGELTVIGESDHALTFGGTAFSGPSSPTLTSVFTGLTLLAPQQVSDAPVVIVVGKPHHFHKYNATRLFFSAYLNASIAQVRNHYHVTQKGFGGKTIKIAVNRAFYNSATDSVDLVLGSYKKNKPLNLTAAGLVGVNGLSVPTYTTTL